jgi:hypothetical protein
VSIVVKLLRGLSDTTTDRVVEVAARLDSCPYVRDRPSGEDTTPSFTVSAPTDVPN